MMVFFNAFTSDETYEYMRKHMMITTLKTRRFIVYEKNVNQRNSIPRDERGSENLRAITVLAFKKYFRV